MNNAGACLPLELGEELLAGRAEYIMDLMYLVELVVSGEEREEGEHFEVDAADAPVIHLVIVVTVCQQALRRPVPSSADVLRKRRLRVDPAARAEIRQLHLVLLQQDVLSAQTAKGSTR